MCVAASGRGEHTGVIVEDPAIPVDGGVGAESSTVLEAEGDEGEVVLVAAELVALALAGVDGAEDGVDIAGRGSALAGPM